MRIKVNVLMSNPLPDFEDKPLSCPRIIEIDDDEIVRIIKSKLKGKWIKEKVEGVRKTYCSCCGMNSLIYDDDYRTDAESPYCPWCGAQMKGSK